MTRKIAGYGWRKDSPDPQDHVFGLTHAPAHLPKSVSLRDHMPSVYDQLPLGACTGNAIAAAMEYAEVSDVTPSRLFIYYQERVMEGTVNEDSGAEIRDGLKVVATQGVPPETDWPYDISTFAGPVPAAAERDAPAHKAISYARIVPGYGAPFRAALAAGFPVVFGFTVPEKFEGLSKANPLLTLPTAEDQMVGGHAVLAVGYDFSLTRFPVNVVEVRNSWSADWGDDGYFFMDAKYFTDPQLTSDFWTIKKAS